MSFCFCVTIRSVDTFRCLAFLRTNLQMDTRTLVKCKGHNIVYGGVVTNTKYPRAEPIFVLTLPDIG